jgi:hypothetical protein
MGTIISLKEGRQRLAQKRQRPQETLLNQQLRRGDPVNGFSAEGQAYWFGMSKPPAPSISHLAGFIVGEPEEDEFPPPAC